MVQSKEERGEETDWAEIFTEFLSHTNLTYEAILERTIPALLAIRERLPRHIDLKRGFSVGASSSSSKKELNKKGKPPTIQDIEAFCGLF